jgi:uncharacterized membrane protein YgdD (TMEM256/DUF423 family)
LHRRPTSATFLSNADKFGGDSAMRQNTLWMLAGLAGMAAVALGAFGAHALRDLLLQRQTVNLWQTAVLYHLVHTVALLALTGWKADSAGRLPRVIAAAAGCWLGGILLFSGSLYGLALGGPRLLGPVTPVGGLLLLAGWVLVMISGRRPSAGPASS